MFATLLLIRHVVDGGREATTLYPYETLADELMRLYPRGLGNFEIYLREVRAENLIPLAEHETHRVIEGERYILCLRPGAAALVVAWPFIKALLIAVAVQVITKALTPKPKQAQSNAQTEAISPNNALAGQTNVLRPGARVPDILGRQRCWPDLIANPQETWNGRTQWLVEWFVLGMGAYHVTNKRLGETSIDELTGVQLVAYGPGAMVPAVLCVKRSPLVDNVSLLTESSTVNAMTTTFTAAVGGVGGMNTNVYVPMSITSWGVPVRITNTVYNNGLFDVVGMPSPFQTAPPFIYSLVGPTRAEVANNAIIRPATEVLFIQSAPITWLNYGGGDWVIPAAMGWVPEVGQLVRIRPYWGEYPGQGFVGTVVAVTPESGQYRFWVNDVNGNRIVFPTDWNTVPDWLRDVTLIVYDDTGVVPQASDVPGTRTGEGIAPRAEQLYTPWTDWQTAPFYDPLQLLLDFAFPQGLAWYYQGERRNYSVQIQAEFRRLGAAAAQATRTWTYTGSTQGALRYTEAVVVAQLGLPAGSPYIQTRVRRVTPWQADNNDNQYIADSRWQTYSAAVQTPARVYGNMTLLRLTLQNTRQAASIGETSFNVVATRMLPTWSGGMWFPEAPSERWADALVARMKATDGANKLDADIDLAGIYAIQNRLEGQDDGDQGRIALTLDQQQDIDSELQTIASVARCQLYRIGPRLYCERDEGGKTAVALFTGRSKHPDAETVSVALASDADPDAVIVPWWDRRLDAWKQREYQWPEEVTPINPLRIAPAQATWAQAYRRARYEWNRLTLRRDTMTLKATEEASLVHPGDVVNVADDVGNLSQTAGEVIEVRDRDLTLRLDQDFDLSDGSYVLLLRSFDGRTTDVVAITQTAPEEVRLERPARFPIKGRDDALGTMFALYRTERSVLIPWLVSSIEPEDRYMTISATNWTEAVFAGDFPAALPPIPIIPYLATLRSEVVSPQTIGVMADEDLHPLQPAEEVG